MDDVRDSSSGRPFSLFTTPDLSLYDPTILNVDCSTYESHAYQILTQVAAEQTWALPAADFPAQNKENRLNVV